MLITECIGAFLEEGVAHTICPLHNHEIKSFKLKE